MSSVSFWEELELPSAGYAYTDDPCVEFAQWGAMEYSENDLLSVPMHWCHHFGKFPRALTEKEMHLAPGEANNPDSASYPLGDKAFIKSCTCYCCSQKCSCVCCTKGEPYITRFGYQLWQVSEFSKACFYQCTHCEHRLFTCHRRARIHSESCGQRYERLRRKRLN